jgi:hypothetical protein
MKITFEELNPNARIWIYQNQEEISETKVEAIRNDLTDFVEGWSAHQQPLAAFADVIYQRFLVLLVDEEVNMASGCSIDTSVNFVRSLETKYDLDLFDRFTFSYQKDGVVHTLPKVRFAELYRSGEIDENTMVFDNLIKTKSEFENNWQKPLGTTWMKRFV